VVVETTKEQKEDILLEEEGGILMGDCIGFLEGCITCLNSRGK